MSDSGGDGRGSRRGERAAAPDATVHGVLVVAGALVALPLDSLREVVPRPSSLDPLPLPSAVLLGAMRLRGTVLPVVDGRALLTGGTTHADDAVGGGGMVVVVAACGRLVGLVVDQVAGVAAVDVTQHGSLHVGDGADGPRAADDPADDAADHPADEPAQAAAAGRRPLVRAAFPHPDTGTVVTLLDATALVDLPGVPSVDDTGRRDAAARDGGTGPAARGAAGPTLTLLRIGEHRLALAVGDVHAMVPSPSPRPSVITSGLCLGLTTVAGHEVPVVDLLHLVGLGRTRVHAGTDGLALQVGGGLVVLAIDELLGIVDVGAEALLPVPPLVVPEARLLDGLVDTASGTCLVLSGPALRADADLRSLGDVNLPVDAGAAASPTRPAAATGGPAPASGAPVASRPGTGHEAPGHRVADHHVTLVAGARAAVPLRDVHEVVAVPAAVTRPQAGNPSYVVGLVVHRGAPVPVVRLSRLLVPAVGGTSPAGPEVPDVPEGPQGPEGLAGLDERSSLLLVRGRSAPALVGFLVERLESIEPVRERTEDPGHEVPPGAPEVSGEAYVRVGDDPALLLELDLPGAVDRLHAVGRSGRAAVPAPRAGARVAEQRPR